MVGKNAPVSLASYFPATKEYLQTNLLSGDPELQGFEHVFNIDQMIIEYLLGRI